MRFSGNIGFAISDDNDSGIVREEIEKFLYIGDILDDKVVSQNQEYSTIDNVGISTRISVIADAYANSNYLKIRFVEYMGQSWKVSRINSQYPRLILTLGGIYNEIDR